MSESQVPVESSKHWHFREKSNSSVNSNSSTNLADRSYSSGEDENVSLPKAASIESASQVKNTASSQDSEYSASTHRSIRVKSFGKREKFLSELYLKEILGGSISITHTTQLPAEYQRLKEGGNAFECGFLGDYEEYASLAEIQGAILSMSFSDDGKYLAVGSQDGVLRVWCISSAFYNEKEDKKSVDSRQTVGIFHRIPYRIYVGHKGAILEVAWSKHNFLCSAGMDKTVRVWHISEISCLCSLQHNDCVTGARFHPLDDRFLLTGSLDGRVRIWSLAEKKVKYWNQVLNTNYITAVSFTSDGSMIIAGTFTGECIFFEFEELKYFTQIEVKSSRSGQKGKKITGIECISNSPGTGGLEEKIVISSNDSRIRVYNLRDKSLLRKYKGHESKNTQIKGSFSDDGRYIISGSEDKHIYIWHTDPSVGPLHLSSGLLGSKSSIGGISVYERFGSIEDPSVIPCAIFAPNKTRLFIDQERGIYRKGSSYTNMEDAIIIAADCLGRIKVYENEIHGSQYGPGKRTPSHIYQPLSDMGFAPDGIKKSPSTLSIKPKSALVRNVSNATMAQEQLSLDPSTPLSSNIHALSLNEGFAGRPNTFDHQSTIHRQMTLDTHFMPRTLLSSAITGRQRVASAPGTPLKRSNSSVSTPTATPTIATHTTQLSRNNSTEERKEYHHRKYHSYSNPTDDDGLVCEHCGGKYFEFLKGGKIKCTQCAEVSPFD